MIRKNNKGFTLIEVIAVVVLLGIMSVFVVPRIYELVTDSRKDIYVEDAIRLISQAQYTMNSKSVKIEKPDEGEVILFSMKYLSTNDFQNPPNGGTYLSESSFVMVKNIGGDYIYSTMIVERTKKNQYMGVELTTEKALYEANAKKHVRLFEESEIAYFDDSAIVGDGRSLDATYINEILKVGKNDNPDDWHVEDDDIIGLYNNERGDDANVVDTATPRITAKFSTSGALKTVLTISAKDADTNSNELRVCIKISKKDNDSYPNPNDTTLCEGYGNENYYEKEIDFGKYGFDDKIRETAYVYILVADPTNNYARKRMTYDVHENEPPVVKAFTVTKGENDKFNMPKAEVRLDLADDMTKIEDLYVCFVQDQFEIDANSCTPFDKKYGYYFGDNGVYYYTFKDKDGKDITKPDGSTHTLRVFVKDKQGLVVKADAANYEIYDNKPPTITFKDLVGSCLFKNGDLCSCTNCNSLKVKVDLTVSDDITDADDLDLLFYEKDDKENKFNKIQVKYSQYKADDFYYTFSGEYDGNDRTLFVDVIDKYGASASSYKRLNDVYEDKAPTITLLKDAEGTTIPLITSAGYACNGADSCEDLDNGGTYNVILNFDVNDDITNKEDIKVCVSEDEDACKKENMNTASFIPFSSLSNQFEFSTTLDDDKKYPTEQVVKHLYIAAVDGKNHYTSYKGLAGQEYSVYHNAPATIDGSFKIISTDESDRPSVDKDGKPIEGYEGGLPKVEFNLEEVSVTDDFTDYQVRMCYHLGGGDRKCTDYTDFSELKSNLLSFNFKDENDKDMRNTGADVYARLEVKDSYGEVSTTKDIEYKVYNDKNPLIESAEIESSTSEYNSFYFNVTFKVKDYNDTFKVCVTDDDNCETADFISFDPGGNDGAEPEDFDGSIDTEYEIAVNGVEQFGWSSKYENEDPEKHLKLYVLDSYGHKVSKDLKNGSTTTYKLYELCSDPNHLAETDIPSTFTFDSETNISTSACEGKCYRSYQTTTNTSHVNYLTGKNDKYGNYKKTVVYEDTLIGETCSSATDEKVELRCDDVRCFNSGTDTTYTNPNLIGLELVDENTKWYYSNSKVVRKVGESNPACENLGEEDYFYPGDSRCDNEKPETETNGVVDNGLTDEQEEAARYARYASMGITIDNTSKKPIVYCEGKATEICKTSWDNYEQEVEAYELEMMEYLEQQLINEYSSEETQIEKCSPIFIHLSDPQDPEETWIQNQKFVCREESVCNDCHNNTITDNTVCDNYYELPDESSGCDDDGDNSGAEPSEPGDEPSEPQLQPVDCSKYQIQTGSFNEKKCNLVSNDTNYNDCKTLETTIAAKKTELINGYKANHPLPQEPECQKTEFKNCLSYYDFCDSSFTTVYKSVVCQSTDQQNSFRCSKKGYSNGYCREDDDVCTGDCDGCVNVCYEIVNCADSIQEKPVTFTCNGYFKTYQSSYSEDGQNILLRETPLRICPEFYRYFSNFYKFESSASTPYVKFNPKEIGLYQDIIDAGSDDTGDDTGDDGDDTGGGD